MATKETPAEQVEPAAEELALSLEEFCTRLSATDRRVELIGGFFASERRADRAKDVESAFRARFLAFATQPA